MNLKNNEEKQSGVFDIIGPVMIRIRESHEKDREQLLACADHAFKSLPQGGFGALLPKLYGPKARVEGNHLIAEEDGTIQGLVLAEPMDYRVLEERLKIAGVGTVSVAEQARGRGIMKALMKETVIRLKREGYAFALLGGQRQRYAYWGFEPCGTLACFQWNQANLRHSDPVTEKDRIELVPMKPGSEECEKAFELWNREPVRVERDHDRFYDILCSWQSRPYVCMKQDRFAGYAVIRIEEDTNTGRIKELVLEKGIHAAAVLHAADECLNIRQGSIRVSWKKQELLKQLEELCEAEHLECDHKFLILDWCTVLKAMLILKQSCQPLQDNEAVLGITQRDGDRIVIRITVKKGQVSVIQEAEATTDIELTASKAARILFRSTLVHYEELERLPAGWFPLPLYVDEQDCC